MKNCPDDEVESLALTFSVTNSEIEQDEVDLLPGGRSIAVSLHRLAYHELGTSIRIWNARTVRSRRVVNDSAYVSDFSLIQIRT